MTIMSYDELIRALLVGLLFSTAIFPGYFLISIPMNRHIRQLEDKLDGMRINRLDQNDLPD